MLLVAGLLMLAGGRAAGTCGNITNGIIGTGSVGEIKITDLAGCCDACLNNSVRPFSLRPSHPSCPSARPAHAPLLNTRTCVVLSATAEHPGCG